MSLDSLGYARLRGKVPSEQARAGIVAKVSQMEGVVGVIDRLEVDPTVGGPEEGVSPENVPPPPAPGMIDEEAPAANGPGLKPPPRPVPFDPRVAPAAALAVPIGAGTTLLERVRQGLAAEPALAGTGVQARVVGDVVTLSGAVPTAYEAMRAYQVTRSTPGVGQVDDELQFTPPQAGRANPLIERGRPDEVAGYLAAQVARQLGGAVVPRVEVDGTRVRIAGQVLSATERSRVEAVLRSMPLLRGFDTEVDLVVQ
jgi:hypothetical protein